jgi:hypothetical protein
MKITYMVFDRDGDRFDFIDDDDHEHYVSYDREADSLTVRQWSRERPHNGEAPIVATFFRPTRCMRDWEIE